MDLGSWWIMDVVGPFILLIVLIWLVLKVRSNRDYAANQRTEDDTRKLYAKEEERRREGTDEL